MQRDLQEKLTEVVLGEAVMSLLEVNAPLNGVTLVNCIKKMITAEVNPERSHALNCALAEVKASLTSAREADSGTSSGRQACKAIKKH